MNKIIHSLLYYYAFFSFFLIGRVPKKAKEIFCTSHILPWCSMHDSPTFHCNCVYCKYLPREFINEEKKRCRYCLSYQYQPKSGEVVDERGTNETIKRLEELSDNFFHIRVSLG